MEYKIDVSKIEKQLEAADFHSYQREFSALGFCNVISTPEAKVFEVYDMVILNLGTYGYTEFQPSQILPLTRREDRSKLKVWIHKHPIPSSGKPGEHCWSSLDRATILNTPLGGVPSLVGWSLSIVKCSDGWVGRADVYKPAHSVRHIPMAVHYSQSPELPNPFLDVPELKTPFITNEDWWNDWNDELDWYKSAKELKMNAIKRIGLTITKGLKRVVRKASVTSPRSSPQPRKEDVYYTKNEFAYKKIIETGTFDNHCPQCGLHLYLDSLAAHLVYYHPDIDPYEIPLPAKEVDRFLARYFRILYSEERT